ncbi:MAG: aspartate kinase [Candidatus Aenigmarchaeota archaeon]|nr:aspartate kinase [Candidatus Aenigmarchaeota archaeon]
MTLVMKFGGTSLGDGRKIKAASALVKAAAKDDRVVVVVSAMAGITDSLLGAAGSAYVSSERDIESFVESISKRHKEAIAIAIRKERKKVRRAIDARADELREALLGVHTSGLTEQGRDRISAFGEKMSAAVMSGAISEFSKSEWHHGDDGLILTDENFVNAEPDMQKTCAQVRKRISPQLRHGIIPVVTGFMGCTPDGHTTTLGRGSSDHIASILGACLGAREVQIWTDVDGLLTADPRIVGGSRLIGTVSFREAGELAYFGAKVVHPKTMLPAVRKGIPIRILNTFNPGSMGTEIKGRGERHDGVVKAITSKKGITLIDIVSTRMLAAHGFLAELFGIFGRHGMSIDLISTTEVSVSVTIDENVNGRLKPVVEDLERIASVKVCKDRAMVCVVGEGMREAPGTAGRVFSRLGRDRVNVECISQGASEISICMVVKEGEADHAVRILHDEFFPGDGG